MNYQYDNLKRLTSAETAAGPEWGQSFQYDGFGNLLSQIVTKGSAPPLYVNVNPATNRITTSGYGYDDNGNLTAMPLMTMSYKNVYFGRRQVYRSYIASSGTVFDDRIGPAVRPYFPYGVSVQVPGAPGLTIEIPFPYNPQTNACHTRSRPGSRHPRFQPWHRPHFPVGVQVTGGAGSGLVWGPTIGSPGGGVSYTCSTSPAMRK